MPTLARTLLFAAAFAGAGFLGRLTIVDGGAMSLVWPAAGVAVLWFLMQGARLISVDTLALALTTYAVNAATGAPPDLAVVFTVANVAQVMVVVTVLRRTCPHLWGCGGNDPLATNRDLGFFLGACGAGAGTGMALGVTGLWLTTGAFTWEAAAVWMGRNLTGAVLVGVVGLVTGHRLVTGRRLQVQSASQRLVETTGLIAATTILYTAAFALEGLPLAFPIMIVTVWAGLRFGLQFVAWHSLAGATVGIVFTLQGLGPFASVENLEMRAVLVQVFVVLVGLTGVAIAIGREERAALTAELAHAGERATAQAGLLTAIVDAMGDGLMVVDADDRVVIQNPAAVRVLGFDSDLVSREARAVVTKQDGQPLPDDERPTARALRGENIAGQDFTVRLPDGSLRDLRVSATHLPPVGAEEQPRAVLVFHDVTEDREQREDLKAFAGVVAHDILNPLTSLTGWAFELRDELEDGLIDAAGSAKMVDRILASSERMRNLVDDLLANATAQDRALDLRPISLTSLVDDIVQARDLVGSVLYDDLGGVTGDAVLVRQLFENLIGNSVKYVAPGTRPRIEIVAKPCADRVQVCLADNGIGIPPSERERIFERFHRAHAKDYPGSGLGLHICRRTVERHGGTITVRDNPMGQGSVFEFSLPADR